MFKFNQRKNKRKNDERSFLLRNVLLAMVIALTGIVGVLVFTVQHQQPEQYAYTAYDFYNEGRRAYVQQNYGIAIAHFTSAIELDAEYDRAYYYRAVSYYRLENFDAAIDDYTWIIENGSYSLVYDTLVNRGRAYRSLGNYDAAFVDFDEAVELDPDEAYAYRARSYAYGQLEQFEQALIEVERAIELNPYDPEFYNGRGRYHYNLGNLDLALADYNYAIELDSDTYNAYNNRGYLRANSGDYEAAIPDYDRAIELYPEFAYAYNNRAYANFRLGNMETVFDDYARSIELDSSNPEVFHNRGITYYELGIEYYDLAIADYETYADLEGEFEPFMQEQIEEMQSALDRQE